MTTKRFKIQNVLFYPLSLIFGFVVWVRNLLFNTGLLKSHEFDIPIISVGNITVGGTGKTPHVEYLAGLLLPEFKIAVLSRGYKRKTKGFFLADETSTASEIGDEPCQIKHRFPEAVVAVEASRVKGIQKLLRLEPDIKAILLDDAFQHRYVAPGLSVLLVDYNRPVTNDFLLPYGSLREMPSARSRADIIIVTKCPDNLRPIDQRLLEKSLKMYAYQKVYFTKMVYGKLKAVFPEIALDIDLGTLKAPAASIFVIAGIARPAPFVEYIQTIGKVEKTMLFPDHHSYTVNDLHELVEAFSASTAKTKFILTTAKDAVKIKQFSNLDDELKAAMHFIPISVAFHENDEKNFNHQISSYVRNNRPDNILYKPTNKK